MSFNFLTDIVSEEIIKARYFNGGKIQVDIISKDLIDSMKLITIIDTEEILYYDEGIYKHHGVKRIKELLILKLGKYLKKYHIQEIIIQIQGRTYISRDKINSEFDLIHLNNGIYNIKTNEFINFSPDIYATNKIPLNYDPDSDCPLIDKFLAETLEPDDIKIIYELFGYVLFRGYPFHYAYMFIGGGSNGKSVLINLFKAFLGRHNVSNIPLQDLGRDKFAGCELFDKMANLYPDLSERGLKDTNIFKALTGGDGIDVQGKFQPRFHLDNHAKLIFSCNTLPKTCDNTDAFFRRWIIIGFPNKFTGKKADKFLINKLTTPSELSGLFNRAVRELAKILINGDFSYSKSTENTKNQYIRMSDSLRAFVLDCVDTDVGEWITKEDFYNSYCHYCRDEEVPIQSKKSVGMALPTILSIDEEKVTTSSGRKEAWKGIKFKTAEKTNNVDKTKDVSLENYIISDDIYPEDNGVE